MTKVWAVGFATFKEAAAALIVRCSSSASATRRRLPFGVSGALRCCIRVLLEVVGVEHPQPLGGPGSTSRRSERGEARQLGGDGPGAQHVRIVPRLNRQAGVTQPAQPFG